MGVSNRKALHDHHTGNISVILFPFFLEDSQHLPLNNAKDICFEGVSVSRLNSVVLSAEDLERYVNFARSYQEAQCAADDSTSNWPTLSSLDFDDDASSATPYAPDPHAVSRAEAMFYYAGLASGPVLLYRTGKEQWSPPRGPEAQRRLKELCEVFTHPITRVWNDDLGWKVVGVLDAHMIRFTTIDVVRFKKLGVDEPADVEEDGGGEGEGEDEDEGWDGGEIPDVEDYGDSEGESELDGGVEPKKPVIGPVTIWIGVSPDSVSATAAHDAAQAILVLLEDYQITDVDIDFRESYYIREVGPRLHEPIDDDRNPLADVIGPLTPALGLHISAIDRPDSQGTMTLYLAEGGDKNRLLGLSCRHVLLGTRETNGDYTYKTHGHVKKVILLGPRAFTGFTDSIKLRIAGHVLDVEHWRRQIEGFKEEKSTNAADVETARAKSIRTQVLVEHAEQAIEALVGLLKTDIKLWRKREHRILGHVLRSPPILLGDWGIFKVDRAKLGEGFQGNKIDLGTKLSLSEFTAKCYARGDANWVFRYPVDRLLPLTGTLSPELMRKPDMWDENGEPCLLVVKNGNATGTTIGRANGPFSIVRDYFNDTSIHQTSMEWAIINYDSNPGVFSKPGDSGAVIADIRGRIGGMLTGGAGRTTSSDLTYATPFWWLLESIKSNGFPNTHLNVV
ncbi:hypothetical protein BDN72DRAFT_870910 [Pluteus cervinus]|uniref:Uncharacterized protein n=1 Tax=Pluteus cervinus TaxID=181527 RepID=A0ACD3ATI0_9AGAR|nr:hypothetical protein BDN72DRAFT_870910 [Pluteus cervinus]